MPYYEDPQGVPKTTDGRVTHVGVKTMAARVITVGSPSRAQKIASLLEGTDEVKSARGFTTITGLYKGVEISVVATGMGSPMQCRNLTR